MKRLLFVVAGLLSAIYSFSIEVTIRMKNQQEFERRLVWVTDSTITVENDKTGNFRDFTAADLEYFFISKVAKYTVADGRFVREFGSTMAEIQEYLKKNNMFQQTSNSVRENNARALPSSPNEVIGRAFSGTGAVALGVGLPAVVIGGVLWGYGSSNADGSFVGKARCSTAGVVLVSAGSCLTIISIPLLVHGKKVSQLNLNYTGNGAGVSVGL